MNRHFIQSLRYLTGLGICVGLMSATQLQAALTIWDPQGAWPSGTSPDYTGNMSGTWENKSWSTNYFGAGVSPTNWFESSAAVFGVGTGTNTPPFSVLMNANHTVAGVFIGSLNPNSCNVTVYGPGVMSIASGLQGFNIHNSSDGALGILTISNTIAGTGIFNPQNNGEIFLCGSNTWATGTSLGYNASSWNGTVCFTSTNAFGTGTIYTSNCLGGALVMTNTSALTITNPLFFPTPTSATLYLVGGSAGVTYAGPVTVNQAVTLGIGSVLGPNQVTFSGIMGGSAAMTITNSTANTGTLTLAGNNTYSGSITIQSGTLALAATGSLNSSPTITVEPPAIFDGSAYAPYVPGPKQTLNGFGTVNGDISISSGARIAGGISSKIGTLTNSGSLLLQSGGTNIVYVQNVSTGAGVGNSIVDATNNIGVLATSSSPFTIRPTSITGTGAAGAVSNFDRTMPYSWTIATAILGDVTNFDASDFTVDASAFANSTLGGSFSVSSTGTALDLNYTPQTNVIFGSQTFSGHLNLFVNQSYTLAATAGGLGPLTYQWFTNGVADTTSGTGTNYQLTAVQLAQSGNTYQLIVTGADSTATNLVTLTVLPWPSVAYESNVLTLQPVAFWPMHEVESAAQGDVETNYGSLGVLGNGYYPDWAGSVKSIQRGAIGAIVGDADTAVFFTNGTSGLTNSLYVPHTSPLTTLNPPFSVECWYYPTNNGQNDIWSQDGFEGLNAGASGAGNGKVCGIRLYAGGNGVTVYTYNNSSTLESPISCTNQSANSWVHIVVTCDASTNFSLYTNGVLVGSSGPVPTEYAPDYWTPFEIGNGRGNTRACAGVIDEVAIYTNVLQSGDITAHYTDGLGGVAGQYFADVMVSNPAVYLRMDAPAYTPPPAATWPALTNYGTLPGNGVYSPGTLPGILPAPNTNGLLFAGFTRQDVALLSGVSSFADAGFQPAFNPVGATPFTVSAMFRGNPCDNRIQEIVGHSANSWGLVMSTNGTVQCQLGTNTASLVISTNALNDGNWHQVVEVYTPNSTPNTAGTNALYVDGILNKLVTTVATNGVLPGSTQDVFIGSDPQFTNNPVGVGRQFSGAVCDVALFTKSLTAAQVQQLYIQTVPATRFSNLSPNPSLTTAYGTATATFSGTVSSTSPAYPALGETVTVAIPNVVTNSTTIDDSTGDFTVTAPINTVPAGTYVITYSYLGSTLPRATDTSTTLTITKAPVTVTANDQTKTYGQTLPSGAGSTLFTDSGLQNGDTIDTVTLAFSGTPDGSMPNAPVSGSPYTITPSAATGGTFTAGNYDITYDTGSLTVNPLPVGLTGTRPYDGTATADFSILSITNIIGTDVVTLASGSATLASSASGSEPITSASGLTLGGAQAGNYTTAGAIGAVTVTVNGNPTSIGFSAANNALTLSWPIDHTGWLLQAQTNDVTTGLTGTWVNVDGSDSTNQVVIPVDPNNGTVFYRLMYNP